MYTVHSNTIYPWFHSKTKPKLVILHRHRSRCFRSLMIRRNFYWRVSVQLWLYYSNKNFQLHSSAAHCHIRCLGINIHIPVWDKLQFDNSIVPYNKSTICMHDWKTKQLTTIWMAKVMGEIAKPFSFLADIFPSFASILIIMSHNRKQHLANINGNIYMHEKSICTK